MTSSNESDESIDRQLQAGHDSFAAGIGDHLDLDAGLQEIVQRTETDFPFNQTGTEKNARNIPEAEAKAIPEEYPRTVIPI